MGHGHLNSKDKKLDSYFHFYSKLNISAEAFLKKKMHPQELLNFHCSTINSFCTLTSTKWWNSENVEHLSVHAFT